MALSVASLEPISSISYATATPMNYAVSNESGVSDTYTKAVQNVSSTAVGMVPPVQYPNAQLSVNATNKAAEGQKTSQAYNDIAAGFDGLTTSYGADRTGTSYATVGQNVDVYA